MTPIQQHLEKVATFVVIARCRSLQKAAVQLRLSQPSLSKTIKILEDAVGMQLLHRGRQGTSPTAAGQILLSYGEKLLSSTHAVERDLAGAKLTPTGTMRVVCHEVIAGYVWPQVIQAAKEKVSKLSFSLCTVPSAREMARQVVSFEADLAIGAELPLGPSTVRKIAYQDHYGFYIKAGRKTRSVNVEQDLPLIYLPISIAGPGGNLQSALARKGFLQQSCFDVQSYETIIALAIADLGIAVLPRGPARFYVEKGLLAEHPASKKFELGKHTIYSLCRKTEEMDLSQSMMMETLLPGIGGKFANRRN